MKDSIYPGFRKVIVRNPKRQILREHQTNFVPDTPETLGELIARYETFCVSIGKEKEFRNCCSVIVNYLVVGLGGTAPKGQRTSAKEVKAARKFLDSVPFDKIVKAEAISLKVMRSQNLDSETKSKKLYHLRKLIEWIYGNGWISDSTQEQIIYSFKEIEKSRLYVSDVPHTTRGKFPTKILGSDPRHFDKDGHLISAEFEESLEKFRSFLEEQIGHREVSSQHTVNNILRILGWLHQEKGISLEKISLSTLVPHRKLKYSRHEVLDDSGRPDRHKKMVLEDEAREDSREDGDWLVKTLQEYVRGTSPGSTIKYFNAVVNLAKFVYFRETDDNAKRQGGYHDVPVIQKLSAERLRFDQQDRTPSGGNKTLIPRFRKTISWERAVELVEQLRVEATMPHRYNVRKNRQRLDGTFPIEKIHRSDLAIAVSFRRFLVIALLMALPPRRPRVYRELELDRTLKYGYYSGDSFQSKEQMSNPQEAQWYIHLLPEDYKTGNTYYEQWLPIPNIVYSDGRTLYEYIEEWLTRWRPVFKPKSQLLFVTQKGNPLSKASFSGLVKQAVHRFTGVPVNPHSFRTMFVTYLKRIGATEQQLEAAARAQAHSRATQSQIYDQQAQYEKMQPVFDLVKSTQEAKYAEMSKYLRELS